MALSYFALSGWLRKRFGWSLGDKLPILPEAGASGESLVKSTSGNFDVSWVKHQLHSENLSSISDISTSSLEG